MNEATTLAKQKSELEDDYMYFSDILEEEKEEALETGRCQQKLEDAIQTAIKLLRIGLSSEQIAEVTELPLEKIKELKN